MRSAVVSAAAAAAAVSPAYGQIRKGGGEISPVLFGFARTERLALRSVATVRHSHGEHERVHVYSSTRTWTHTHTERETGRCVLSAGRSCDRARGGRRDGTTEQPRRNGQTAAPRRPWRHPSRAHAGRSLACSVRRWPELDDGSTCRRRCRCPSPLCFRRRDRSIPPFDCD